VGSGLVASTTREMLNEFLVRRGGCPGLSEVTGKKSSRRFGDQCILL